MGLVRRWARHCNLSSRLELKERRSTVDTYIMNRMSLEGVELTFCPCSLDRYMVVVSSENRSGVSARVKAS